MSVADYGSHPTSLSGLSDQQLYGMYRTSSWSKLTNDERQELMQETVNRAAAAHGEIGSQQVTFKAYTDVVQTPNGPQTVPDTLTIAQNGRGGITVNSNLYTQGKDLNSWGGNDPAAGLHVLEALLHENEHAYQDQVIHDVIPAQDPDAARQYKANDFTQGLVMLEDGSLRTGSQYIMADTTSYQHDNYYLYYLSSTERDAFRFSQAQTLEIAKAQQQDILSELQSMMAADPEHYMETPEFEALRADYVGTQNYILNLEQSGYEAMLESAQGAYQDKNIEQDINSVLTNHYYHENVQVPKNVEKAVNEAMVLSYQIQTGTAPQLQASSVNGQENPASQEIPSEEEVTVPAQNSEEITEETGLNTDSLGQDGTLETGENAETGVSEDVEEAASEGLSEASAGTDVTPSGPSSEPSAEPVSTGSENGVEEDGGMEM